MRFLCLSRVCPGSPRCLSKPVPTSQHHTKHCHADTQARRSNARWTHTPARIFKDPAPQPPSRPRYLCSQLGSVTNFLCKVSGGFLFHRRRHCVVVSIIIGGAVLRPPGRFRPYRRPWSRGLCWSRSRHVEYAIGCEMRRAPLGIPTVRRTTRPFAFRLALVDRLVELPFRSVP